MIIKRLLNEWQWGVSFHRDWRTLERGWKVFEVWVLKFTYLPELSTGEHFRKEWYEGFHLRFAVWFPVDRAL